MKKIYSVLLLIAVLFGMGIRTYAADVTTSRLQATHMGYYNDGKFIWRMYFNDNQYYAKCYLGASVVKAPTWVSSIITITDENTKDADGKLIALPISYVFEDAPSGAKKYTYTKTVGSITETHDLSYTVEDLGAMATVYSVEADKDVSLSGTADAPLELTVPDEVTLTLDGKGETKSTIANVKVTQLGVLQNETYFWHLGDALHYLGVPVRLKLGANVKSILANTFRVNNGTNESDLKGCDNLYGLDFNGSTTLDYIGSSAFKGASNLKLYPISPDDDHAVKVPTSLTQLQDSAFANSGIKSLVVTQAIPTLGNNVFENCDNMEYVSFVNLKLGTNNMLLSRDIEAYKKALGSSSTVETDVDPMYQRLVESIPTHVLVYAPKTFNKDYQYLDKSVGGYNIITTGDATPHCYHFYVYDNTTVTGKNNAKGSYDYWVPIAFTAETCEYNRSFPTGWVTAYLPFDWKLPSEFKAYQAASDLLTTKDGTLTLSFEQVDGTDMKANTPYVLYNSGNSNVTIAKVVTSSPGLTIPKSPHPSMKTFLSDDAKTKAIFWGTTEDIANDSAAVNYQAYNIRSDQKWGKVSTSAKAGYIGRFRGFVSDTRATAAAKPFLLMMTLNGDGETTAITTVDAGSLLTGNDPIYTLDGRCVGSDFTSLPNGVYIKKGKKFVIKRQ